MSIIQGTSKSSAATYEIDQSIRFNDDDDAHLYNTSFSASPTSSTDCTFSTWVKRGNFGSFQVMLYGGNPAGSTAESIRFDNDEDIRIAQASSAYDLKTDQKFRDVAGWYHIVVAFDTDNATASERIKLYVNGERVTSFSIETYPSSGYSTNFTSGAASVAHVLGANAYEGLGPDSQHFDGYQAEINFVDGQALDPTSFGETNSDTGQWVPVKYTGSYGTNGFYITGADSADLGADDSGNGNNFTSSSGGFTAADQMLDTPTNNFCTLNTIEPVWGAKPTISNGNLDMAGASATVWNNAVATFKTLPSTGKWIWAAEPNTFGGGQCDPWIVNETGLASRNNYVYVDANGWETTFDSASVHTVLNNGAGRNASFTYGSGDFHVICFDADSKKLWFGIYDVSAGTLQFHDGSTGLTGDPGAGTNPTYTLTGNEFSIGFATYTGRGGNVDFGQSDLLSQFTAPTDFKTLCTANLPDPTVALPEKYFNTVLYEGNGGGQRVGQFQPITETYTVPNSAIFNASDSNYLTRTPSGAGSATTMTWSYWVKRAGNFAANNWMWGSFSSPLQDNCFFDTSDRLVFTIDVGSSRLTTTRVFRDSSTWLHVVLVWDSSNATSGDRMQMYIDGVRQTSFSTETYPSSGASAPCWNTTNPMEVGRSGFSGQHGDTYMADFYFIDGQALGPDSFGQLDASTNKWIPKDASGLTFGTNGFYLDFESGKESTSGASTTNMNATQFVNGSMGSWGTGDTAYDFTGGTTDRNINTGTSFIASSTDFDFYGTLSAAASPNAPFLGWYTSGTNTNAGTPSTTASAGVYGRNGNSTGSLSGWLLLSSTREAERPNKSWEFQRKVGVHRRGSQLYGSLNGRIDHKYSSTPSTTSAGGFFLGNSGDGTSYTWSNVHSITYSSTTQNQYGLDSSGNVNNFTEEGTWDFLGGGNLSYDTPTRNSLGFWDGQFETGSTETDPEFGNTKINNNTGNNVGTPSRGFVSSGKWYYEIDVIGVYNGTGNSTYGVYGVVDYDSYGDTYDPTAAGNLAYGGKVVGWQSDGTKLDESSSTSSVFNIVSAGDVIQIALDMDNGAVWFGKNNTWELSATASEIENGDTSNAVRTGLTGEWSPVFHRWTLTERVEINAGSAFRFSNSELSLDTASGGYFKYTPPSGFKSLNNDSLPLSNGDLSAFVWIKNRDAADNHMLFDAVRGATKDVHSNSTAAEVTNANTLTRFLKNGFEVSNDAEVNTSAESYVAWQWLNDSLSTSSNADGDITSTVLANTTSGVSIVKYAGSLSTTGSATVGHGLGTAPLVVISKSLDSTAGDSGGWSVQHTSLPASNILRLNTTAAPSSKSANGTLLSPTSTVFYTNYTEGLNVTGNDYIAYCFAEVEGFSKFGSYTGNGSTDGAFVYTGFKPAFVLWKQYTNLGTNSWGIRDSARDPSNVVESVLRPDTTGTETTASTAYADFLSNGFKLRATDGFVNKAASNYLYMAFAESPFKTANAR